MNRTEEAPQSYAAQMFSLSMTYRQNNWFANFNTLYRSGTEQLVPDGTIDLDSYWLGNLSVGSNIRPDLEIIGKVLNLADEKTYSPSKVKALPIGVENRGRTFSVGLRYHI